MPYLKNKKILYISIAIILILLTTGYFIIKNTNSPEKIIQQDSVLSDKGIVAHNKGNLATYLNPFSLTGELQYLAPEDQSTKANVGKSLSDQTLVLYQRNLSLGQSDKTENIKINQPQKVLWGNDGKSLLYISKSGKTVFLVDLSSGKAQEIARDASDISFSNNSKPFSYTTGAGIFLYDPLQGKSFVGDPFALNAPNSSVASELGIVYIGEQGKLKLFKNTQSTDLAIQASLLPNYSFKNYVYLEQDSKTLLFGIENEKTYQVAGDFNLTSLVPIKDSFVFAFQLPGQSDNWSVLACFNQKQQKVVELYRPTSDLEAFDADSIVFAKDKVYFSWADQLFSKTISEQDINNCIN